MVYIEKYEFTYQDYLNYYANFYDTETEEKYLMVREPDAEYIFDESKTFKDKKHDKIFKDILQNKEEMAKFINTFVKYNVKAEQLEIYNSNFITEKFEYKNADIVYKIKDKEIYFLIEHQTKVDYSMPYRILNYCIEIIKNVVNKKEINRASFKYPKVIPIVLYTGSKKWTVSNLFSNIQVNDENNGTNGVEAKYKLIDINNYEISNLLQENTLLTNVMILEKCKNKEDIIKNLELIIENNHGGKKYEELKRIIFYLYGNRLNNNIKEFFKSIEESESEGKMLNAKRIIENELKKERREGIIEGKLEGILEGISQTIERMIKMNLEDDFIKQATGAKKSEIEKIRKNMKETAKV